MLSRRAQKSVNWLADEFPAQPTYPEGVVKMDSAENWLVRPAILPIYKQAIQSHLVAEHLSYNKNLGGHPGLLQATAGFANAFFAPRVAVAPEHVVAGAGAAAILDSVDFAVCEADEGLLIDAPMWEGFGLASRLRNDGRLVPVARPPEYASAEQALRHYAAAVEAAPCRVRGVIVCNPQNPYGHIYPRFWLEALLQFCEARDLHYISDEIYGMSTFEPESSSSSSSSSSVQSIYSEKEKSQPIFESPETTFTSILSMDLKRLGVNPARVHVIYGISKDLGSSGLRLGFLITQQNPALRHALSLLNRFRVSNASSLMGLALFSDLRKLSDILAQNRYLLRAAAARTGAFLAFHDLAFYRPAAGCFLWARLGGRNATATSDAALWQRFADAGVALAVGGAFHEEERGWFRITYALPSEDLDEGLRRIETALRVGRKWRPDDAGSCVQMRPGKGSKTFAGLVLMWIAGWF